MNMGFHIFPSGFLVDMWSSLVFPMGFSPFPRPLLDPDPHQDLHSGSSPVCDFLCSFSITSSRYIHVVACMCTPSFPWPNYTPVYGYTISYLFIHHLVDICIAFSFLATIMLLWTFSYKCLCKHFFICLGYIPRSGNAPRYMFIFLSLIFWRRTKLYSTAAALFYIPTSNMWEFQFLHILINPCSFPFFLLFIIATLVLVKWYLIIILIYISLVANDVDNLFMSLSAIPIFSWRSVYSDSWPLLNWIVFYIAL